MGYHRWERCVVERLRAGKDVGGVKKFDFKATATNVWKWDRTSVPTGHLQTQNGSNLRPKFGLSVRIRIEGETILGPISVCIRIGHFIAYTRVLGALWSNSKTCVAMGKVEFGRYEMNLWCPKYFEFMFLPSTLTFFPPHSASPNVDPTGHASVCDACLRLPPRMQVVAGPMGVRRVSSSVGDWGWQCVVVPLSSATSAPRQRQRRPSLPSLRDNHTVRAHLNCSWSCTTQAGQLRLNFLRWLNLNFI